MGNYLNVIPTGGATTPFQAAFNSGTSSIDLRMKLLATSWNTGVFQTLWSREPVGAFPTDWQWLFSIDNAGKLYAEWVNSAGGAPGHSSTVVTGFANGSTHWVRTLMNIGAGTLDFFTSTDGVTWTNLGTQSTGNATTGLATAPGTPVTAIGVSRGGTVEPFSGRIYHATLLIGGSTTLDMNFETAILGSGTWTADTGEVWTQIGTTQVVVEDLTPPHAPVPFTSGAGGGSMPGPR